MIDYTAVIAKFNSAIPESKVVRVVDYDKEHYLVEAMNGQNGAFYGIDKWTDMVTLFIPSLEIEKFFEAIEKRTLYCSYEDS